jgi:hypothetical protein
MSRVHRSVMRRLGGEGRQASELTAAVVDTPYRFQENADAISAGLLDYFGRRLGMRAEIASVLASDDVLTRESALARIRQADFVFSGPGSPSYVLRQWSATELPAILAAKMREGGAVVVASAAALTLGRFTVPVYEIYKAGHDPYWMPGLDVLSSIGISAAIVPHWDNAEGAGHDTRFCFLGERRLKALAELLPADVAIVGVDEHTALVLDLDADRASVRGRGSVTLRRNGREVGHPNGEEFAIDDLRGPASPATAAPAQRTADESDEAADLARKLIALESSAAAMGSRASLAEPLVQTLIEMRAMARANGSYAAADLIRDRLAALGVELADASDGTTDYVFPAPATKRRRGATRS